ncbi:MAG: hypothetical protein ACK4NT_06990, partial [Candidatus Omnitrophota bacterium]
MGFYISQIVLEKKSIEFVEDMLFAMLSFRELVNGVKKQVTGKDLDLWTSDEDVQLLSLAVDLARNLGWEKGLSEAKKEEIKRAVIKTVAEALGKKFEDVRNIETLQIEEEPRVEGFEEAKNNRLVWVDGYLGNTEKIRGLLNGKLAQGIDMQQWAELVADLLSVNSIERNLIKKSVEVLEKLEVILLSNNEWFSALEGLERSTAVQDIFRGEIFRFKGEDFYLDLRDPQNRGWAKELKQLFKLKEILEKVALLEKKEKLEDLDKEILTNWQHLFKEKRIDLAALDYKYEEKVRALFDKLQGIEKKVLAILPSYLKDLSQEEILEGNRVVERIDKVKLPDAGNFSSLKRELLQGLEDWQEIIGKEAENLLKENNPLSAWITLRNEVNTIKQVLAQLEQFKPDSQFVKDFLKEFVLGEDFNIGDSEHLKVYEEWFGLRIPEAEESLHRLLEINNPKERENLYTFARSVYIKKDEKLEPTPVFRLPKARTRKDLIKDQ